MSDIKRISPSEACAKVQSEGYVYVDVRSEQEFAEGHPTGALNIPLMEMGSVGMTPNNDFMQVMNANFSKDAKLVLGCRSGGRSLRAAQLLIADGFEDVIDQRAGWDGVRDPFGQITEPGWSRANLPIEKEAPVENRYSTLKEKGK